MLDNAIKYSYGVYQLALHRRAMLRRFYNNRPDLAFRNYRTTYLHLPSAYHLLAVFICLGMYLILNLKFSLLQ